MVKLPPWFFVVCCGAALAFGGGLESLLSMFGQGNRVSSSVKYHGGWRTGVHRHLHNNGGEDGLISREQGAVASGSSVAARPLNDARSRMRGANHAKVKAYGGRQGGGGGALASMRVANVMKELEVQLAVRTRQPGLLHSRAHCVGDCCTRPLHRNRTCAFRDLLFRPPASFFFLSDARTDTADVATFLHNRFSAGDTTGEGSHSLFAPKLAPVSAGANVTRVVEAPVYIGADVHSNIGHLMLDSVFPSVLSLLRLHASLGATHRAEASSPSHHRWLPDAVSGNFTFLLYDSPLYTGWHRGKKERTWTATLSGNGVVDLPQLAAVCPSGCIVRSSWVGAGHTGLCAVDARNFIGGTREHRSLARYRHRIFHFFGVPHTPLPLAEHPGGLPTVLVVQTKRVVTNLAAFVSAINAAGGARARLIEWEQLSFVEQLRTMRAAAVQISGVGTAMMNQFLMPKGTVAVCLGWREEKSRHGIQYFDSHLLRSLDHARALYYPSFDRHELGRPGSSSVTLDMPKALGVVKQALEIYREGFEVPLPEDANANRFDHAFEKLVALTGGDALMARTDDYAWDTAKYPKACTTMNGVHFMMWGTERCPWYKPVPALIREFDL